MDFSDGEDADVLASRRRRRRQLEAKMMGAQSERGDGASSRPTKSLGTRRSDSSLSGHESVSATSEADPRRCREISYYSFLQPWWTRRRQVYSGSGHFCRRSASTGSWREWDRLAQCLMSSSAPSLRTHFHPPSTPSSSSIIQERIVNVGR